MMSHSTRLATNLIHTLIYAIPEGSIDRKINESTQIFTRATRDLKILPDHEVKLAPTDVISVFNLIKSVRPVKSEQPYHW